MKMKRRSSSMRKVYYTIEVNDGCPWGADEGYATIKAAKKDLKEIIEEDIRMCKEDGAWNGELGMTYTIVKNVETDTTICQEDVYTISK
jgi:hypothetical protein